jgi:hypothetical protein
MSLDVWLTGKTETQPCRCPCCDNEHTREVTETFFDANITHNLGNMADVAGIYKHLWRPDEIGVTKASQLIKPLRVGLAEMRANPNYFLRFNPENGWGSYANFMPWIERYLKACEEYPDADVHVSR